MKHIEDTIANSLEYMNDRTAKPEELFSMGQLFLRWKYDIAQRILSKFHLATISSPEEHPLRLFEATDYYYQDMPIDPDRYQGFLLKLENLFHLGGYSYSEMLPKFSSLFVLKQDVLHAERLSPEYLALPAGDRTKLHSEICTLENLHIRGPQIFAELFTGNGTSIPSTADLKMSKNFVWPWLGPVLQSPLEKKELKGQEKENSSEYLEEVASFIKMAKDLGQENPKHLARMVRHHYPKTTNRELVTLVAPKSSKTNDAIDQRIHNWLRKPIS